MTINSTSRKAGPFNGTGVQAAFPFGFKVFLPTDVRVVLTDSAGSESDQLLNSAYTIAINADQENTPGGTVTMLAAPAVGAKLTITSVVPITQGQSIPNNSGFYPKVIENAYDKITIIAQQLAEQVGRSIKFAISDTAVGTSLPAASVRANNLLGFDADGNMVAVAPVAGSASALQAALGAANGASLIGGFIASNVVLLVPSQFATVIAAMSYLQGKTILPSASVTIRVSDGVNNVTATSVLNHPNGERISLIGNEATPASCILYCNGLATFDCLLVSNGYKFGLIAGFKFDVAAKSLASNNSTAVLALDGGQIIELRNCIINNWYYQIAERSGGRIFAHDCTLSNAGDVAVWSFCGGSIRGYNLAVSDASDVANNLGYGYQAEYGGTIEVTNSTATGCRRAGFAALSNGTGRYYSCNSSGNVGSGFLAQAGGSIEANGSTSTGNTRYGIEYFGGGTCTGVATLTGNTLGVDNGNLYIDQGNLGARLAGNGDIRIDTNGGNSIYFNSSGGVQFAVRHTAASVSWVSATAGPAGSNPILESNGGATAIDVTLRGKGTGSVFLASSQANFFRATGAAVGNGPVLRVDGADTDIDFLLTGKGAGFVRFGTWSTSGDTAVNGYITIKDFAGNVRKIPTIA